MITYMPEIYPDELVYSWFCRYYAHSGCFSHKMAMQELYCKRSDNPSKEFIGNLNNSARNHIVKMYPMEELVLHHTMFPQYARFINSENKRKALSTLAHEQCDAHRLFPVLPRNIVEKYLRFCPLCAAEDRNKFGETYWHRKHQIRNMNICIKHRCRLEASNVPAKSEQTFTFCPAENYVDDRDAIFIDNSMVIQFAEYVEQVFDAPIDFEKDIPLSSVIYHGMSRTKYLKSTGRSRYTKMLADDMREYYEKMNLCSIASMYQIQRVLLGVGFDFSVVCQISFFLGMGVKEITKPILTSQQIEQEQNSHYMKDANTIDWKQLDEETAPLMERLARDIYDGTANENGRPERVSEKLICRELGLAQHRLYNMPECNAIIEKYTESYPETWARKIIWAYEKLKEDGKKFYWSDIRRLTGVKKDNLELIIPFIKNHENTDIANYITALVVVESAKK